MEEYNSLPENTAEFSAPAEEKPEIEIEEKEDNFDDTLEILKIKDKIVRYNVTFGRYLTIFEDRMRNIDDMNRQQLERLLHEISIAVSARTSGNMIRIYYGNAVQVTEALAPMIGMNLNGLSKLLLENEQINECLEELNIKYDVMHHVSPEVRLGFVTINAILSVNSQNKKLQKVADVLSEPVKQEHIEEYADL